MRLKLLIKGLHQEVVGTRQQACYTLAGILPWKLSESRALAALMAVFSASLAASESERCWYEVECNQRAVCVSLVWHWVISHANLERIALIPSLQGVKI